MKFVGLDVETFLTSVGCQAPPLVCVAIGDSHDQAVFHHSDPEWINWVSYWLRDKDTTLVGHYIAFDMAVLANEQPKLFPLIFQAYEEDRITCTSIRQKLCDIAGGIYRGFEDIEGKNQKLSYGLDMVAKRHLGRELDKTTWRHGYQSLYHVPLGQWPWGATHYVKEDVRAAVDVAYSQEENSFYLSDQFRQSRASFWLRLMANWGIRTDSHGVQQLAWRTQLQYDEIARDLREAGLLRPDKRKRDGSIEPGSRDTKAAGERLILAYSNQGKDYPKTATGKPELDKVACRESGDPLLIKYAQLSTLKTVLTKDVPMLEKGMSAPIHSRFEDMLETGRTSSSDPNIQNFSQNGGVRECFVPRCLMCQEVCYETHGGTCPRCGFPSCVYWSVDYGGLELCTQAQMCITLFGRSRLGQALNDNEDPHLMVAAQILKRPYEELYAIRKAGVGKDCRAEDKRTKCSCAYCIADNARQTGKVANFGFPGGLGAAALVFFALASYNVRMTEDEARKLKQIWLETWPEFKEYFRYITTITDKPFPQIQQLFSGRFRGGVRFTEACNTTFQGLGGDIAKSAGWELTAQMYLPERKSPLLGSRMVNFVHDEFVGESPLPIAHECAIAVRDTMIAAAKPWLPDVKIKAEPALMWRYSKKAKPVFKEGRLVPWTG